MPPIPEMLKSDQTTTIFEILDHREIGRLARSLPSIPNLFLKVFLPLGAEDVLCLQDLFAKGSQIPGGSIKASLTGIAILLKGIKR
jgi:hypothetical protein